MTGPRIVSPHTGRPVPERNVEPQAEVKATATPEALITIDLRSVKSRRRRLAIALAWLRIPYDLVVRGIAVIPDR